jgi:hypothetical protein
MSKTLGTIKILEDRIIIKKDGLVEVWMKWISENSDKFITYNGITWRLESNKSSKIKIKIDENN